MRSTNKNQVRFPVAVLAVFCLFSCSQVSEKKTESGISVSDRYKKHLISREQTALLAQEYEKGNYALINSQRKSPDAREAYFDLDVMEGYLEYVKKKAAEKGVKNPSIKIVLGQYPKDRTIDPRQNETYKGYQMIFLVPAENRSIDHAQMSAKASGLLDDIEGLDFAQIVPPERN